jgi:CBS domain-containing protein
MRTDNMAMTRIFPTGSVDKLRFFFEQKVSERMSRKIQSLSPAATLADLGRLIEQFDYNTFPVLEGDRLVGVVTKFDFMRAFIFTVQHPIPDYPSLMNLQIGKIMNKAVITAKPDEPLTRVLEKMVSLRTRCLPVVEENKLVGMISRTDIIGALDQT